MKKILVLNYEFPPLGGGASPVSYEIAERLSKTGNFDIDVVTMGYKNLPAFEKINDNFRIHRVKSWRSKKEICYPFEQLTYLINGYFKCKKLIKEKKFDICHCHFIIPTGVLASRLKNKFGLSYIITSHGSDVPGHNADRFQVLHKFTTYFSKHICFSARKMTTPSRYLANLIKKNIGNYQIDVIPNGSKDYYKENIQKENIILTSGRLLKIKGIHSLIQSFNFINNKKWKLIIVGDGPYKKELQNLAKNNKFIKFTGWLDNKSSEYINLLNKAKIFTLLSESESQGIVFLEAMSAHCAILSSNTTACTETVTEDIGFLVGQNNISEIKDKLLYLMSNEDKLMLFMGKSRERYDSYYKWSKVIDKYDNLLNNM